MCMRLHLIQNNSWANRNQITALFMSKRVVLSLPVQSAICILCTLTKFFGIKPFCISSLFVEQQDKIIALGRMLLIWPSTFDTKDAPRENCKSRFGRKKQF